MSKAKAGLESDAAGTAIDAILNPSAMSEMRTIKVSEVSARQTDPLSTTCRSSVIF